MIKTMVTVHINSSYQGRPDKGHPTVSRKIFLLLDHPFSPESLLTSFALPLLCLERIFDSWLRPVELRVI